MDKRAIIAEVLELLAADIARATDAANRSRHDATHEEARPENDKDTRALETSYLARGQAERAAELERVERQVRFMPVRDFAPEDAIDVSALVELECDGERAWYLIAPAGGGHSLAHGGIAIDVLTPQAPLGRALIGRTCGEAFELRLGPRTREFAILQVR